MIKIQSFVVLLAMLLAITVATEEPSLPVPGTGGDDDFEDIEEHEPLELRDVEFHHIDDDSSVEAEPENTPTQKGESSFNNMLSKAKNLFGQKKKHLKAQKEDDDEAEVEDHQYNITPFKDWDEEHDFELRARPMILHDLEENSTLRDLQSCKSFEENNKNPGSAVSTVSTPWKVNNRKVCKLFMTWSDGSSGVCSGSLVGPNHLITAAHCTLDGCGNGFASRVLVKCGYGYYPGAKDYAHLGTAYVSSCTHYKNYVNDQSCVNGESRGPFKWDIQLCRLDRTLSHSHGYFGYTTKDYSSLNVRGYPGNPDLNQYISQSTNNQLWRFNGAKDISSKQYRLDGAWIWGGESGCPYYAYNSDTKQRFVNAVHNGGPTGCYELGRRVDQSFFNIIKDRRSTWKADSNWCNVIEDYANVASHHKYPWKGLALSTHYTSYLYVRKGSSFKSKLSVINVGPKATGNFNVYYYAKRGSKLTYLGYQKTSVPGWSTKTLYKSSLPTSGLSQYTSYEIIARWYPACKTSADPKEATVGRIYVLPAL